MPPIAVDPTQATADDGSPGTAPTTRPATALPVVPAPDPAPASLAPGRVAVPWMMRCTPMERPARSMSLAACGLGLILASTGCRSTRPEVPPGRAYAADGRKKPAIGFSTDPHPIDGAASAGIVPETSGGTRLADEINQKANRPDMSPALDGARGSFGPPGTAPAIGRVERAGDERVLPAGAPDLPRQSISPLRREPAGGTTDPASVPPTTDVPPADLPPPEADPAPAPTPGAIPAGQMGRPDDLPSPN